MRRQRILAAGFVFVLSLFAVQTVVGQEVAVPDALSDSGRVNQLPSGTPEATLYSDSIMEAHAATLALRAGPQPLPAGFSNSPTGALLRSVAFPGGGQWFNGKKKKAFVYFAAESYFIVKSLIWRARARKSNITFATFDHARDRRNYFNWLTGFTIFISMFDAYGDRYLLMLERTRSAPDEYWGGQKSESALVEPAGADDFWRLTLTLKF